MRIGLAGAQYTMLVTIAHLGRHAPLTTRQDADHLHVAPTFVTAEAKKLEAAGLIEKGAAPPTRESSSSR